MEERRGPLGPRGARARTAATAALARVPWARALWASLLVLHVGPLVQVFLRIFAGEGGWGALGALVLTQALFAAKLADVRWLRMPSRRGAVVAFLLATCLAHPQQAFGELGHAVTDTAAVAALAAAPAAAKGRPRRWLTDLLRRAAAAVELWRDAALRGLAREARLAPVPVALRSRPPGRAPPRPVQR